jgi:cytochrome c oxidase cbb3-type subunit 3
VIGRRIGIWPAILLLAPLAAGCTKPGASRSEGRPVRSDRVLDFATLYGRNCAGCHGADGQYGPAPPLNDPLFLAIVPDTVLSMIVAEGRPGTPMPAFSRESGGPLTDVQVQALAAGIKSRWKAGAQKEPPVAYAASEGHGKADPSRGRRVFARACASCHGEEGLGGEGKVGPIHDPAFLALISDQAIRRTIITGRRDLGMPDFAGKDGRADDFRPLTPAEVADLVELVADWRRAPDSRRAE